MPIQQRSQLKGFGQSTNEKYIVEDINDLNVNKQDLLESGVNIKTINGNSILGPGDLSISGGSSSVKTIALYANPFSDLVTGTTSVTVAKSIMVPADTFNYAGIIELVWSTVRYNGSAGNIESQVYVNTIDSLSGANLIATGGILTNTQWNVKNARDIGSEGGAYKSIIDPSTSVISDYTPSNFFVATAILDWSVDLYFLFCIKNSSAADFSSIGKIRATLYV